MNYQQQTKVLLEFDHVIAHLVSKFISPYAKDVYRHTYLSKPYHQSDIEEEYRRIAEFHLLKTHFSQFFISEVKDFSGHIQNFHIENYFMDIDSIVSLKKLLQNIKEIKNFFQDTTLKKDFFSLTKMVTPLFYDAAIVREIEKIIDEKDQIKSSASKELKTIRERKSVIFAMIDKAFQQALTQAKNNGYLHEINESIRQGRRVLAIQSTYKKGIKGMILDESESGNIAYIEPSETIFLNNEASEIDREEQREIRNILIALTKFISKYSKLITQYQEHIVTWDIIQAKSKFMDDIDGSIPKISKQLSLQKAFHPILKLKNKAEGKKIVPFTLTMTSEERLLMISGPNAGGKSVTLKTIGIIALMVQYAIPISAEGDSAVPMYDTILGDLGDMQSIDDELSTYSSKLTLWKYILKHATSHSLLLFDELGDGTDPSFGSTMAQVVLESCLDKKAMLIATTHYSDLKKFGENRKDTIHANMIFDEVKLEPLFQLSIGLPGSSYTFHIARKMGLPTQLIQRAESLSQSEKIQYDKQLFRIEKKEKELHQQKQALAKAETELKKQMKDWNRLHLDLDLMRKKINYEKMLVKQEQILEKERELNSFKEDLKKKKKTEDLLLEQKRIDEEMKVNQEKTTELFKQIHRVNPNQNFQTGDRVQFIQTNAIGLIESIQRKKATVIFDNIKTTIPVDQLILIPPSDEKKKIIPKKLFHSDNAISRELDLRGKYVYEALPELEDFINKSLMNNFHEVKVIHGIGKLRTEILKAIKTYKSIVRFHHGISETGGEGVTFIYF